MFSFQSVLRVNSGGDPKCAAIQRKRRNTDWSLLSCGSLISVTLLHHWLASRNPQVR